MSTVMERTEVKSRTFTEASCMYRMTERRGVVLYGVVWCGVVWCCVVFVVSEFGGDITRMEVFIPDKMSVGTGKSCLRWE